MRQKLQQIRESAYDRPQMPFVCGLAAEGIECPLGPHGGRCSGGAACFPVKEGDRWTCGRPISAGGACESGPGPDGACCHALHCTPTPSVRVQRGRWIAGCILFTAGLMLILLAGPWRNEILAPGPLTTSHAQIIRRDDPTQRCASCHTAGNGGLADWCLRGIGLASVGPTQSQLCLKCHEKMIPSESALQPHSLPLTALREKTEQLRLSPQVEERRAGISFDLKTARETLECATCHREHHGKSHDLKALTNQQCNTCHERTIVSFAHDHPEFSAKFAQPQSQLAFVHQTHRDKYFVEVKQSFQCNTCHLDDPEKNSKVTASFAQACASCHGPKIRASTLEGLVFLQLPTLDVAALRAAGEQIDAWPNAAEGDFDGRLPWPMRMLLASDPEVAAALVVLGEDGDFADLDSTQPEHLHAAAVIARGIASLWNDLGTRGHPALEERLALLARAGQVIPPEAFTAGLSPDTLAATASWLPVASAGNEPSARAYGPQPRIRLARYDDDALLSEEPPAINPFRKPRPVEPLPALEPPAEITPPEEPAPVPSPPAALPPARPGLLDAWRAEPLHRGTWYADEVTFSLRYIPQGHADPILSAWTSAAVNMPLAESQPERKTIFQQATSDKAAGLCVQCHIVTKGGPDNFSLAWKPQPDLRRGFTKFSHRPHLIQPQLADCSQCHSFKSGSAASGIVAFTPGHSDFEPILKHACVSCHRSGAADDCLQCHNYHVDLKTLLPRP